MLGPSESISAYLRGLLVRRSAAYAGVFVYSLWFRADDCEGRLLAESIETVTRACRSFGRSLDGKVIPWRNQMWKLALFSQLRARAG